MARERAAAERPAGNGGPRRRAVGRLAGIAGLVLALLLVVGPPQAPSSVTTGAPTGVGLGPTAHRPLPTAWQDFWFVPEPSEKPGPIATALAEAVRRLDEGDAAGALAALRPAKGTALEPFVHLTAARALQRLDRRAEARERLDAALAVPGERAVTSTAVLARAGLAEAAAPAAALADYQQVFAARPAAPDAVLAGILRTATAAGDVAGQQAAALALHFEFPVSPHAAAAAPVVAALRASAPPARLAELDGRELARADRLFDARRYAEARAAYLAARRVATGADAVKADVRAAVADYHLDRHRAAAEALAPLRDTAPHEAEARYFHLRSLRALGQRDAYVAAVRDLADRYPTSPWAAEALNHLASYFIVDDQDDRALEVFARVLDQHPAHRHAERAAWKLGWARYREGRFAEAAATFERGTANAPRSDYRPAWLYWSGRAHERAGDRERAAQRFRVAVIDYQNSYYGRLAATGLKRLGQAPGPQADAAGVAAESVAPATGGAVPQGHRDLVRMLLAAGLLDFAAAEVEFAQRTWGNGAALDATLAWIHHRRGDLRRGITLMRRAYPQFMAAGGERLPDALQRVIFPVAYGGLIDRYARQRDLDPYLVAALVAQESSFQPDARSVANALGLMQIMPATGRRLARTEGVRRFSTARLIDPELNVRLGTRYFAGLVDTLGGEHLALASYNAGKSRVDRWLAERPGLPPDEFIDDIPFPETQNYVKRILGTAEDYRRLYGDTGLSAAAPARSVVPTRATPRPAASAPAKTPPRKSPAAKAPAKKAPPKRPPAGRSPARGD